MNLKKLLALEAAAAREGNSLPHSRSADLPHEQDDNTLAHDPYAQIAQGSIVRGMIAHSATSANKVSSAFIQPGSNLWSSSPTYIPTTTDNASPEVITDGDDLIMIMKGGRENIFQNTINQPLNIDGNARRFRMTRKEAQALAILLVKAAAEEH